MTAKTISYQKIEAPEAKRIMENDTRVVILDVREKEEYLHGHIKNAINIPLDTLTDEAESFLPHKEVKILVYCRSGIRSREAAEILSQLGYDNVLDFGGILSWNYGLETK